MFVVDVVVFVLVFIFVALLVALVRRIRSFCGACLDLTSMLLGEGSSCRYIVGHHVIPKPYQEVGHIRLREGGSKGGMRAKEIEVMRCEYAYAHEAN